MANRIADTIARKKQELADKLAAGTITQAACDKTSTDLDMELGEFANFQTLKTLAVAHNLLTAEEGQLVYVLLGETPSKFNSQPLEVKIVLSFLHRDLLERRIGQKRRRR